MNLRLNLLLVLMSMLPHWGAVVNSGANAKVLIWNISVANQSKLDHFIESVTAYNDRRNKKFVNLSLVGKNNYTLDIVKLMNISFNGGSLIIESKGGPVAINCTASQSSLEKLRETVQPISRASHVLLDGLVFTKCPVPIIIEEATKVVIQNCVFQ